MNHEHYFDLLTKLMAGSLPRRDALRRFGAVVAGAVFGPLGFNREASATLHADCQRFCKIFSKKQDADICLKLCEKTCPSPKMLCCSGNKIKTLVCCTNGVCTNGICKPPTCSDHVKNGTETDVDCGGSNCPKCGNSKHCNGSGDCQSGICTGGICQSANLCAGVVCDDGNPCTTDSCDPATGRCVYTPANNGQQCGSPNGPCTIPICQNGTCSGTAPINNGTPCGSPTGPCSVPVCQNGTCSGTQPTNNGTPCGSPTGPCSIPVCQGGTCSGTAPTNNGQQCGGQIGPCLAQFCQGGTCQPGPVPNGTSCNDGNACTQGDTCQGGMCVGGSPVICPPAIDQCHSAGVCNPSNGTCSNPPMPDGTACNDGDACTQNDVCQGGICIGTNPVVCTASDQCHAPGTCDPNTGACSNPAKADGTACSDDNACTQTDTCQAGTCVGSNPVICSPVTNSIGGVCNPATGQCNYTCAAGFANCDGTFANGCETNTQFSNSHCGGCGIVCPSGTSCSSGVCES